MDVVTEMPRKMTEKMDVEPTPPSAENIQPVFPPPLIAEETANSEPEFPAPPRPEDLEALSLEAEMTAVPPPPPPIEEDPMITTPRTLRRADSMRQRMAARRIQRTWKHFYQELEEKKSDVSSNVQPTPDNVATVPKQHQDRVNPSSSLNGDTDSLRMVQEEVEGDEAIAGVQAAVM